MAQSKGKASDEQSTSESARQTCFSVVNQHSNLRNENVLVVRQQRRPANAVFRRIQFRNRGSLVDGVVQSVGADFPLDRGVDVQRVLDFQSVQPVARSASVNARIGATNCSHTTTAMTTDHSFVLITLTVEHL